MRPALPLALLLGAAAIAGWRVGSGWPPLTESDLILRAAADWRARGGDAADCVAVPGDQPGIWVAVSCGGEVYLFDRRGRRVEAPAA